MLCFVLNPTCFYVHDSSFGFQRDGLFNAEIISTSLARCVPLHRFLCLGLASYLLDHCRISVMMSRSVLCSRAIGCLSIQCERSWSKWVDEKLAKLTVIRPQSCSEAIIWEALQNILHVQYWFPRDRRAGRRNLISMRSDLSIKAQPAFDGWSLSIGQKRFRRSMILVSSYLLRTPQAWLMWRQLVHGTRLYVKPLLGLINCLDSSYKLVWRLRFPPSFLPKIQKGYSHKITENISLSYFPISNVFVGPLRSVLRSPTTQPVHRLTP